MRRHALILAFAIALPAAARAQRPVPLIEQPLGVRLRLETTNDHKVDGILVGTLGDTLVVQTREATTTGIGPFLNQVRLPTETIARAFVSTGPRSRLASGGRGAVYGAVVGIGAAVFAHNFRSFVKNVDPAAPPTRARPMSTVMAHYVIVAAPIGAVAGALLRSPRWTEVPKN